MTTTALPSSVTPDDVEAAYEASRAALSQLSIERSGFPSALQNAVAAGDVDLILTLRRRRSEADVELDAAELAVARDLVLLREQHSARALAQVTATYGPMAHAEAVLRQAQALFQASQNDYQQACSDRDFFAYDLRQARSDFARLTAEQMAAAAQSALRQRL